MPRHSQVDKEAFLREHHAGLSLSQLAERFNISARHATRLRRDLGVAQAAPDAARRVDDQWRARAAIMLAEGAPVAEVARTLGSTFTTVKRHFPGSGWDRTAVALHAKAVRECNAELRKRGIKP